MPPSGTNHQMVCFVAPATTNPVNSSFLLKTLIPFWHIILELETLWATATFICPLRPKQKNNQPSIPHLSTDTRFTNH